MTNQTSKTKRLGRLFELSNETAQQSAERIGNETRSLIELLRTQTISLQAQAAKDVKNWGYAGSLGHIKEKVLDLLVGFECAKHDGDEEAAKAAIFASI